MKYFLGTYEPTLLTGGQVALPKKIRQVIDGNQIILSVGFDRCVSGFSLDGWEMIVQEGISKPSYTQEGRQLRRQIFGSAEEVKMDSQGRFVVPISLRDYAGLTSEIIVIGAGDHFEIWDKSEWVKVRQENINAI